MERKRSGYSCNENESKQKIYYRYLPILYHEFGIHTGQSRSKIHSHSAKHSQDKNGADREFTRLDYSGTGYEGMLDSYFPDEGDQPLNLGNAMLEDEIYTRIRINPESLPLGDVLVIPSMQHNRFRHLEIGVQKANTKLTDSVVDNQNLKIYTLNYQKIDRSLSVVFEAEFPHKILQFRESFLSGFGDDAHKMTTVGTLTNSIMLDYWTKNNPQDTTYRKSLGLSQ